MDDSGSGSSVHTYAIYSIRNREEGGAQSSNRFLSPLANPIPGSGIS